MKQKKNSVFIRAIKRTKTGDRHTQSDTLALKKGILYSTHPVRNHVPRYKRKLKDTM